MAVHEGKDLGQNFVGTEHILLALIAESDGVAMRTLDKLNVDIQKLRSLILRYIEETQESDYTRKCSFALRLFRDFLVGEK